MKKYTAALLLLGYAACIAAQQDPAPEKPFTFGVRGGYFSFPYNRGLNYYGAVTVSRKIHELSLGPRSARPRTSIRTTTKPTTTITG